MKSNPELVAIFRAAFTDEHKANVRHHLAAGTRILCGVDAYYFADGRGGG